MASSGRDATDETDATEPPATTAIEPRHDVWLVRHGETEWAKSGRHTGRTDVPLTDVGRAQARSLGRRLAGHRFALVLTSPLARAAETAALAGFPDARTDPDLREWDYGSMEGRMTSDIRDEYPDWTIWDGPWPNGETIDHIGARCDRLVGLFRDLDGDALVFAHGHVLRVLAARWLDLPPTAGRWFALGTATISRLGWEREDAVIEAWNQDCGDG
jgi:broad specificity phosphatase PhoE